MVLIWVQYSILKIHAHTHWNMVPIQVLKALNWIERVIDTDTQKKRKKNTSYRITLQWHLKCRTMLYLKIKVNTLIEREKRERKTGFDCQNCCGNLKSTCSLYSHARTHACTPIANTNKFSDVNIFHCNRIYWWTFVSGIERVKKSEKIHQFNDKYLPIKRYSEPLILTLSLALSKINPINIRMNAIIHSKLINSGSFVGDRSHRTDFMYNFSNETKIECALELTNICVSIITYAI